MAEKNRSLRVDNKTKQDIKRVQAELEEALGRSVSQGDAVRLLLDGVDVSDVLKDEEERPFMRF